MITDLVVCVYNENIEWLHKEQHKYNKIYVYVKNIMKVESIHIMFNDYEHIKVYSMNNIGSCDHAYLYHIIKNYYNLPDKLVLCKGTYNKYYDTDYKYYGSNHIYKYLRLNKVVIVILILLYIILSILWFKNILSQKAKYLSLFTLMIISACVIVIRKMHYINRTSPKFKLKYYKFANNNNNTKFITTHNNLYSYMTNIFNTKFVDDLFKNYEYIIFKGYFSVSRENIQKYPISVYKSMINYEIKSPNRDIDHFHERIWGLLFSNSINTKTYNHYNNK